MLKKVELLSIDKDTITPVQGPRSNVYGFFVEISENPSLEWNAYFMAGWKEKGKVLMFDVVPYNKKIQIRFRYGEDMQTYVDDLLDIVDKCNKQIEKKNEELLKLQEEQKRREEEEEKKIESLKNQLKTINL